MTTRARGGGREASERSDGAVCPGNGVHGSYPFDESVVFDVESGEVLGGRRGASEVRLERFALQSVSRGLLSGSRVARCLRVRQGGGDVQVLRSRAGTASYGGLQTCGSVWVCPVCAAKISERRRVELLQGIAAHEGAGGAVVLLTLTHPHTGADVLGDLLRAEQVALARFFGSKAGVSLFRDMGRVGHVRAWEVTHGRGRAVSHGWHPHFHILLFLETLPADLDVWEGRLFALWENACRLGGLDVPSRAHGVRLDGGSQAGAYVAKWGTEPAAGSVWGFDAEMTKGHSKRAREGETPFDLLRALFLDGSDDKARGLFREYSEAFHGKRQLSWSRGLRERLGLDLDEGDEALAAMAESGAELLGRLTVDEWRAILKCELRGELLELARSGWGAVRRLLDSLDVV